jgi:hypothetical protein
MIPDTQLTPESDIRHIEAAGRYLAEMRPDKVIIIGDWWDLHSLNTFDKAGSKGWEAKDLAADLECGNEAMASFLKALRKPRGYSPEVIFTEGNHEYRATRAAESPDAIKFRKYLDPNTIFKVRQHKIKFQNFLDIVVIDGIMYSHYFHNPDSKMTNPIGGSIQNRLWKLGGSFCAGHEQVAIHGQVYTALGHRRCGIVCGRFYQEDMEYLGPQKAKQSWSGIYVLNDVKDGSFDMLPVSMEYLIDEK